MITKILIFLVAVVLLIVIIAVLALRFLRADDSDSFEELPDEPRRPNLEPAQPRGREQLSAAAERTGLRPEPARDQHRARDRQGDRTALLAEERGQPGYRDRDSQSRPARPERRSSPDGGQRPAAAAARASAPNRQADPDSESNSWESLSDVDYWAELAADKPLTATMAAPASRASSRRRSHEPKPEPKQITGGRAPGRGEQPPQLPVRQRQRPQPRTVAASAEPATQNLAALARLSGLPPVSAPRPTQQPGRQHLPAPMAQPSQAPAARVSQPHTRGRPPLPMDDDPLTSPSFPAINASDSRSYRTRRSRSQPAGGSGAGGYSGPAQQVPQYPAGPDSAGMPSAYAGHSGPPPVTQASPPVPAATSTVAGNPYGSFVSQPASYQEAVATAPTASSYGGGYVAGGHQPATQPDPSWYGTGAGYAQVAGNAGGYPLDGGYDGGYYGAASNGAGSNGAGYNSSQYQPAAQQGATYPPGHADPGYAQQGHLAGQYDQRGYPAPDLAHGRDGYQGYPGGHGGGR